LGEFGQEIRELLLVVRVLRVLARCLGLVEDVLQLLGLLTGRGRLGRDFFQVLLLGGRRVMGCGILLVNFIGLPKTRRW